MKTSNITLFTRIITCVFLLFSCFYMYDFYKCLSGFIANGFREPLVMLPMILAFFLPVFCFLFFFYDFYVRAIIRPVKIAYSAFVILYAIADLTLIFLQMDLYMSNNALGVYDALPSIFVHFPYDMVAVLFGLIAFQVLNIAVFYRESTRAGRFIKEIKEQGFTSVNQFEYAALCLMAIIVFVFTGAAIYASFSAIENALYDFRYVYLLIWVMIIPMANLLIITLKPEKMNFKKSTKLACLGTGILSNLVFGVLFLIFELTSPDFLIHIGKPVFLITFSVSMPIEPCIIFAFMAIGTIIMAVRFFTTLKSEENATEKNRPLISA